MTQVTLAVYGAHGHRVRVFTEGDYVRAVWRELGVRRKRSWPSTRAGQAEAKAWASAFAAGRGEERAPKARLRTDTLWSRYVDSEFRHHRPKTQSLYTAAWRKWQVFVGPERIAEDLGPDTVRGFRQALDRTALAPNTVHRTIQVVKTVYAWARSERLLARNEVRDYRFKLAKEKRPTPVPEYSAEEFAQLCAALPLDRRETWRPGGIFRLCGLQGARPNAVLHLRWEDIDLEAGLIRWRPRWDKLGRDEHSPIRPRAREVLLALRPWTEGAGWLFPPAQRRSRQATYHLTAFIRALHVAERKAGVESIRRRAGHSLRRMAFNDVLRVTGNIGDAMDAIRDRSLQVATRYVRGRPERLRQVFAELDRASPDDVGR